MGFVSDPEGCRGGCGEGVRGEGVLAEGEAAQGVIWFPLQVKSDPGSEFAVSKTRGGGVAKLLVILQRDLASNQSK